MNDGKRLIEDYLPIEAISVEAAREKNVRKGHIASLHLWWARRPLVACRAAVYGALVPASRFVPNAGTDQKRKSLGRANAAKFVKALCQYPGSLTVIEEAKQHILEAHAHRLTKETGKKVSVEDIVGGKSPRPKVLDMFAGGGAIPLEALRLGCSAHALDLNPVAHIVELCTLVYPQTYGKADLGTRGMAGPKGDGGQSTWGGLADEVRYWGNWVLEKVKSEIGDLYPSIPDPAFRGKKHPIQADWLKKHGADDLPLGYLTPIAYLWTRTVICKNPTCKATVPLVKHTWLCKKEDRYVALKMVAPRNASKVRFEVVEANTEAGLKFDPTNFSKRGNAPCPFCSTVADIDYVKAEGRAGRLGDQIVALVAAGPGGRGWRYFGADELPTSVIPNAIETSRRLSSFCSERGVTPPNENIGGREGSENSLGITVKPYGISTFSELFTSRQVLFHLSIASAIQSAQIAMKNSGINDDRAKALSAFLACALDRGADFGSRLSVWNPYKDSGTTHAFGRQTITMVWDYSEVNPFSVGNASWGLGLDRIVASLGDAQFANPGEVTRGSAMNLPYADELFDAVITDPPYYDNVPYSDISDFFYVWLKRSIGNLFPEHFASQNAPKKTEAIADSSRHRGDWGAATVAYENMMAESFNEASRVLKVNGQLTIVYAHKTTLGWTTLVDALRRARFTVTEAWPLDTEKPGRLRAQNSSALATSIFLVARKRTGADTGSYEDLVRPELEQIVRERVETLWAMKVSGADLVIACVGAGLRAFTRFSRVEYANGDEVPAERFLTEVETVVLETILERLSQEVGRKDGEASLTGLDEATRFYVLWRYTYGAAELEAGEAIIFANGTHVELDGANGLSTGSNAVLEKMKGKYHLRDFLERGEDGGLGLPDESGKASATIDALHRLLWLQKRKAPLIPEFISGARSNLEQIRLVAQSLAGPALKGGEMKDVSPTEEQSELGKLLANWQAVIEGKEAVERRAGQQKLL